jgi:uncharacterized protein YcsI (UPF0317 family)
MVDRFAIGCSFSFKEALMENGIHPPIRARLRGRLADLDFDVADAKRKSGPIARAAQQLVIR